MAQQATNTIKNLIIIDGDSTHANVYHQVFQQVKTQHVLRVIQTSWQNIQCTGTPYDFTLRFVKPPLLDISNSAENKSEFKSLNPSDDPVPPSLVIVRDPVRRLPHYDCTNTLYGMSFGNVKMVNSSSSIIKFLERPVAFGALNQVAKRIPNFPRTCFLVMINLFNFSPQLLI